MSELEKRQRDEYQNERKKSIKVRIIIAAILIIATLFTHLAYIFMSKNAYVSYIEDGKSCTKVLLADNSFYDEKYLDSNHAYIASLIKTVETDFKYGLVMDAALVNYKYSYTIDATVKVIDKDSKAPLYDPSYVLKEVTDAESSDRELNISEKVEIDYAQYNNIAADFVNNFGVNDAASVLVLRMNVTVLGECEEFADDKNNNYTLEVNIPLLRQTVKFTTSSSVPSEEQQILACDSGLKSVLCITWRVLGVLSVLMCAWVFIFTVKTRDKHIDYTRRIQKLLSNYKSYIQRVENIVDFGDYKVLNVVTFEELLEIGDKLQSPVLMYENEDKTKSEFFVTTCNGLAYMYVVEVKEMVTVE